MRNKTDFKDSYSPSKNITKQQEKKEKSHKQIMGNDLGI